MAFSETGFPEGHSAAFILSSSSFRASACSFISSHWLRIDSFAHVHFFLLVPSHPLSSELTMEWKESSLRKSSKSPSSYYLSYLSRLLLDLLLALIVSPFPGLSLRGFSGGGCPPLMLCAGASTMHRLGNFCMKSSSILPFKFSYIAVSLLLN